MGISSVELLWYEAWGITAIYPSPFRIKQKNRYKVAGVYYFTTSENNILHKVAGYRQAF